MVAYERWVQGMFGAWMLAGVLIVVGAARVLTACGTPAAKVAEGIGVTVAGDVCKELEGDAGLMPAEEEAVTVACTVEGIAAPVLVTLPRQAWYRVLRVQVKAGDGGVQ